MFPRASAESKTSGLGQGTDRGNIGGKGKEAGSKEKFI